MAKIFISYRREDSQHQADRLHAILKKHVPDAKRNIFIDVDNIPVGVNFVRHLDSQVAQCDVLLALIGPDWLNARDPATGKRRLDDPKDFVRIEIASALKRDIPVAPVLLDGSAFPSADQLPDELKPLVERNGVEVRRLTFDADAERLIRGLSLKQIGKAPRASTAAKPPRPRGSATPMFVALGVILIVAGGGAAAWMLDLGGIRSGAQVASADPVVEAKIDPADSTASATPPEAKSEPPPSSASATPATPPAASAEPASPAPAPAVSTAATAWAKVDRQDPASLRTFIKNHGASSEAETARLALGKLDSDAWAEALGRNSEAGFKAYLADFSPNASPPGAHASDARSRIAALRPAPAASAPAASSSKGFREPEMVTIPAGSFIMGSPSSEYGRSDDEGPQRQVTISYRFEVGKYEVTWNEYNACVSDDGCARLTDDGYGGGQRPVTNVSWNDAKAYVSWLSRMTGKSFRLLSEAEWEYAARARTTTSYSFGPSFSSSQANFSGGPNKTTAVGQYPANDFGLHDMHGNVWEWVEDCYADSYSSGQPSDGRAFRNGSCSDRVMRGGSWINYPQALRSASRGRIPPIGRQYYLGFRIARTLS